MVKTFQIKTTKNWLQNESGVFFDTHTHTHKFSAIGIYQAWLIWKGYLKVSKSSCKKWFHCHVDLIRLCLILCFWKKLLVLDRQIFTSFQAFWMSYTLDLKTFLFGFMGWERESSWVVCSYLFGLDLFLSSLDSSISINAVFFRSLQRLLAFIHSWVTFVDDTCSPQSVCYGNPLWTSVINVAYCCREEGEVAIPNCWGVIQWDPFWGDQTWCKWIVILRDFPPEKKRVHG